MKRPKRKRASVFPKATDEQIAIEILALAKCGYFRTTQKIAKALGITGADMRELLIVGPRLGIWERGELGRILASHKGKQTRMIEKVKERLNGPY